MKTTPNTPDVLTPLHLTLQDLTLVDTTKDYYNGQPCHKLLMGYLIAALWTYDEDAPSGDYVKTGQAAEMLKRIHPTALGNAFRVCKTFFIQNKATIEAATLRSDGNKWGMAGHDLLLTRNGHGSGFWDGDWDEASGTLLTQAAKAFGESSLYEGDDKKLHFDKMELDFPRV